MTAIAKHPNVTLHESIKTLNLALVQQAFQKDSSTLNELDPTVGWSVLYKAVVYEQLEIAQYLIENGADPNVCNKIGETPLHYAAEIGRADFAELFLTHGADANLKQTDGNTAFHIACKKNRTEIIKMMLKYDIDVNSQNKLGTTPLHFAGNNRNTEIYQLLLERNADPTIKDRWGKKPVSLNTSERPREPSVNRGEKPTEQKKPASAGLPHKEEKRREPSVNKAEKSIESQKSIPVVVPHKEEKRRAPSANKAEKCVEPLKPIPMIPMIGAHKAEETPRERSMNMTQKPSEPKESNILKEIYKMKESQDKENALRNTSRSQAQNFQKRLEMMKQRLNNQPKEEPVTPPAQNMLQEKKVIKQKNVNESRILGDITNTFESSTSRSGQEVAQSIDLYHARINSQRFNQEHTESNINDTVGKSKYVSMSLSSLKPKEEFPVVSPFQAESFAPPMTKKKIPSESQPQPKAIEVEQPAYTDKENFQPKDQNKSKHHEKSLENEYLLKIFGKNRSLAQFSDSLSNNTNCTQDGESNNSSELQLAEQLEQTSSEKSKPESDKQPTTSKALPYIPNFSNKLSIEKKAEETQSNKQPNPLTIQPFVPTFSTKTFNAESKPESIEGNKQIATPKLQPYKIFEIEQKSEENESKPTPPKIQAHVPNFSTKISDIDKKPKETENIRDHITSKSLTYVPNFSAKILDSEKKKEETETKKQSILSKAHSNKIFDGEKKLEESETKTQPTPSKTLGYAPNLSAKTCETEKKTGETESIKLPAPSKTQPLVQNFSLKIFDIEKKCEEKSALTPKPTASRLHTQSVQDLKPFMSHQKPDTSSETPKASEVPNLNKKILNIFCQKSVGAEQAQKNNALEKELKMIDWLKDIKLEALVLNFTDNGYHYQDRFRKDYEKSKIIFQNLISRFGIDKYGYRLRITMKLREDSGLFARKGLFVKKPSFKYPTVEEWLSSIGYKDYIDAFLDNGFDDMEYLILQTSFKELPFDEFLMRDDLGIDDEVIADDILAKLRHVCETASQMEPYRYETKRILDLLKHKN